MRFPEIDLALEKLIDLFKYFQNNDELPSLLKTYITILTSEDINKVQLKSETIKSAIKHKKRIDNLNFKQVLNLYLLYKIYLETKEEIFKTRALEIIDALINQYKNEPSIFINMINNSGEKNYLTTANNLTRVGLILISLLSDKNTELDSCIL